MPRARAAAGRAAAVADDALVVFTPSGRRGRFALGTSILQAARELGVDIDSVCGGRALCGRCQVSLSEGEFAKHGITSRAEHLSEINATEARYAGRRSLADGRRLSCQALLAGDAVIDVPAESQVHKQLVRKRPDARRIEIDPVIRLHYVEVAEPAMDAPASDLRRLEAALAAQWGLADLDAEAHVLQGLQHVLRQGGWTATVAVRDESRIVAVWPGYRDRAFGLAIDVGSTTLATHLCDLSTGDVVAAAGAMNPQIRFGEDLMSRVSYVMMNPDGAAELTAAVRGAVAELAASTARQAGIERSDIVEATVVGNPIMHHLFLGLDSTPLGQAPFALATDQALDLAAAEVGMGLAPGARLYVLPCVAGHVGADAAAMVLSEAPHRSDELMLLVDVGTNAEIVLGDRNRLLAASSPTGPAFEGAQISAGQRAAPGAIERVRIDRETLEPRFRVIGCEAWSDDPGFAEATAATGVTGICGSGIIEAMAELYLAGVITADGVIDGELSARSPRVAADGRTSAYTLHDATATGGPLIRVTQADVRAIQLAKAALYAGARLLMDRFGVERVERIVLAGAFGSHIDPIHAMVLGLIPDCPAAKVASAGNAAGTGARIALLNRAARDEIERVVRRIEKLETAVEPRFQAHFVEAMAIPHKTDPFPELSKVVSLPSPKPPAARPGRRRRRRR